MDKDNMEWKEEWNGMEWKGWTGTSKGLKNLIS